MIRSLLVAMLVVPLLASAPLAAADGAGFYGGIALRDAGSEQELALGEAGNVGRFAASVTDPPGSQALVFGGYRWRNDLAIEAALGSLEAYRLSGRGGVGLMLPRDAGARAWNLDVYGSWGFARRFSLYGRLGYSQSEFTPLYSTSVATASADRRQRDGLSYGVGLRYDLNRTFGLRLEYARVGTAADAGALTLPDGDQVQFGVQYRF